jgi:predicted GNAT family N-acyltransferase
VFDRLIADSAQAAVTLVRPRWHDSLEAAAQDIHSIYAASETAAVVLFSDLLVEDGEPTSATREMMDAHENKPLATIACTDDGRRVPEVHRTVRRGASDEELHQTLQFSLSYLRYVSRPTASRKKIKLRIRRLRTVSELRDYYALRYRIYHIMGYLEHDVERAPSHLEIDACDACSLHLGAFDVMAGYNILAGTARLVIGSSDAQQLLRGNLARYTDILIKSDPVIRNSIYDKVLPLMLPVFQSQELNDELTSAMIHEWSCGELSRVIVDEAYRGAGISESLVNAALELARQYRLHKVYLECLKMHVPLYQSLGFEVIAGKRGRVAGVSKTMIPMQRMLSEVASVESTPV